MSHRGRESRTLAKHFQVRGEGPGAGVTQSLEGGDLPMEQLAELHDGRRQAGRLLQKRHQPADMRRPLGATSPYPARWPRRALIVCVRCRTRRSLTASWCAT